MRLIGAALVICTVCGLLIATRIAHGRAQPPQDLLGQYGITPCRNRLCFLGIVPGITSWRAARTLTSRRDAVVTSDGITLQYRDLVAQVPPGRSNNADSNIRHITIVWQQSPPDLTLGTIVAQFGTPCAALTDGPDALTLVYPRARFDSVVIWNDRARYDGPVHRIVLLDPGDQELGCQREGSPWLGFTTLARYRQR